MAKTNTSLTTRTKLLFSTGDLTSSLTLAVQMFFQLYFLTDVARLSPSAAGWVLGLTRAWDAVNDPIVGLWSDRIRSRHGRRRVLLLWGAVPLGLFFAISWLVPPVEDLWLMVYYTVVIIVFDTAFTVVHVGYNSLTPEMTYDYDERSTLNGYRMAVSLSGTLAAIVFATVLDDLFSSEVIRFAVIGVSLGLIATVPPWIVAAVAKRQGVDVAANSVASETSSSMSLVAALQATLTNRAFVMLMGVYLASWTAASVLASMLVYFARYYLQVPGQANYFVLTAEASAVVFVPVTVWLTKLLDKPKAYLIGTCFWCVILLLIAMLDQASVGMAYLLAFLCGPGIATAMVIPWSMVPDIIEHDQQRTGERREGAFYSLVAFFQKLGTGLALWGIGQTLALSGYVTPTEVNQTPLQPDTVLTAMRWIIEPVTVAMLLISMPIAWWYPINRDSHQKLLAELESPEP